MLDSVTSYPLYFVQKASPGEGDAFDFAYIYKFYSERTRLYQRLKYIMRVEAYEDVFAIKFYAARDRKLDNKYNRIVRAHEYRGAMKTFMTCAEVVKLLHQKHPSASFIVQGASSRDFRSGKMENDVLTQRFRIYRQIAYSIIRSDDFVHFDKEDSSAYLLVNRLGCDDEKAKAEHIKQMFFDRGFGD